MSTFSLNPEQPGPLHQLQVTGDDRPVLGHGLCNRANVALTVQDQLSKNIEPHRFAQGAKECCVEDLEAGIGCFFAGRGFHWIEAYMHRYAHVNSTPDRRPPGWAAALR